MNTSELTNKALVLRRLADQFDNLALRQINLDNESAGLLAEFRELIPTPPRFEQERPLNEVSRPGPPKEYRRPRDPNSKAVPRRLKDNNATIQQILAALRCSPKPMRPREILEQMKTVKTTNALSFYLSTMKNRGMVLNPQHGYWEAAA